MMKKYTLTFLKIISILIFISIEVYGEHISVPFGFVFLISLYNSIENLEHLGIIFSFLGLLLVLISIKKRNYYFTLFGYLLSYIMIFGSLFGTNVLEKPQRNSYFFITSSIFFLISIYVIAQETLKSKKSTD